MARKVRGFERVLDAPALFAVAYDEIGSSIYFALGIVAAQALGLTPVVLLATGLLFLVVSLSYAEGTAAIPETGGAATFTRRAFNDLVGLHHGLGAVPRLPDRDRALDAVPAALPRRVALGAVADREPVGRDDRGRRSSSRSSAPGSSATAGSTPLRSCSPCSTSRCSCSSSSSASRSSSRPSVLTSGFDFATGQGWHDLAFALPLAMLAYTGLETVANLAEETREPGRVLPRSLFSSIGLVVIMTVLIAVVGLSAFPAEDGSTDLADDWLQAPIVGIVTAFEGHLPAALVDVLRVVVGLSGALILFAAATTAITGCTRLGRSMAEHGMLPREFGRLERRSLVSREALLATGADRDRDRRRRRGSSAETTRRSSPAPTRSGCCSRSRRPSSR